MSDFIEKQFAGAEPGVLVKGLKSNVVSADYVAVQPGALIVISLAVVILAVVGIRVRLLKR